MALINADFVFLCICSFPNFLDLKMLLNVQFDESWYN